MPCRNAAVRVLRFHHTRGSAAANPHASVLEIAVPKAVTQLLAKLRAATNSWKKTGEVEIPDEAHAALGEFRDAVHAKVESAARKSRHVIRDKKPSRREALGWIIGLNGHVIEYGKVVKP